MSSLYCYRYLQNKKVIGALGEFEKINLSKIRDFDSYAIDNIMECLRKNSLGTKKKILIYWKGTDNIH